MDFDRQQHSAVKALSGPKSRQALQTSVFVSFGFDNRPLCISPFLRHHVHSRCPCQSKDCIPGYYITRLLCMQQQAQWHTQTILVCQYVFEFHSLANADWRCAEGGVVVKSGLENPSIAELQTCQKTWLQLHTTAML